MFTENAYYGISAVGMTMVLITGGIDLSVGAVSALTGMIIAYGVAIMNLPPMLCLLFALVIGVGLGLLMGAGIHYLNVPPFIMTLTGMFLTRGICSLMSRESIEINNELIEETRNLIDAFVKYLVERDLSEDSVVSKRRKQRQLPAFIIYLFSSGMYDLILDCPSMPEIYRNQISFALKKINQTKYEILEEMAKKYEEKGRDQVAAKIREMGLSWFYKEPAEIKSAAEFRDLKLTSEDVDIYREFRPRYTNVSAAITQEVISDYIEVALDEKKGIFEKLKDKTRAEAINDVKRLFKKWLEQYNLENSSLADKLMFK
jgi:hypothetical protein